jgi:hypothetical protein
MTHAAMTFACLLLVCWQHSVAAQTPQPVRQPVLETTSVPPGSTVTLSLMLTTGPLFATVTSRSDQQVIATLSARDLLSFDGSLTLTAPTGTTLRIVATENGQPLIWGADCMPYADMSNVIGCFVTPGARVTFETVSAPAPTESVALATGCNNLVLTWPNGTPTSQVAAAVSPAEALIAVWRFDAAQGRFFGFSPQAAQASDLTMVNRLDAVFLCLRGPGVLARPVV